jgi:tetratricopeptide (TPR) repeat protein
LNRFVNSRDPVHPVGNANLGIILTDAGQYDEAIKSFRKTIELSPDYYEIRYALAIALTGPGELKSALSELQAESTQSVRLAGQAMAYHAMGNPVESDKALQALIGVAAKDEQILIAQVFAFRNKNNEAFKWIGLGIDNDNWKVVDVHTSILFRNLYDDPRWIPLLEQLETSPRQLAAIKFELVLPKQD